MKHTKEHGDLIA